MRQAGLLGERWVVLGVGIFGLGFGVLCRSGVWGLGLWNAGWWVGFVSGVGSGSPRMTQRVRKKHWRHWAGGTGS